MADIFLSYASKDIDKAKRLAQALTAHGSVFWDRTIPTGKTWREHIGSELERARCLVVAWSSASVRSTWVQEEVDDARERDIPVLPVFFEEVRPPLGLRSIQGKNLSHWDYSRTFPAFQELETDINRILGPASTSREEVAAATSLSAEGEDAARPPELDTGVRSAKFVSSILKVTLGWAISWIIGPVISFILINNVIGVEDFSSAVRGMAIIGAITMVIGGGVIGYVLKRTVLSLSWRQVAMIALGWAIAGAIGGTIGGTIGLGIIREPIIGLAIGVPIGLAIAGAIGGGVIGYVLKRTVLSLSWRQVAMIARGWAIAGVIIGAIGWATMMVIGGDIGWAIGLAIGGVIGGVIGGGIMFWCLRRIHTRKKFALPKLLFAFGRRGVVVGVLSLVVVALVGGALYFGIPYKSDVDGEPISSTVSQDGGESEPQRGVDYDYVIAKGAVVEPVEADKTPPVPQKAESQSARPAPSVFREPDMVVIPAGQFEMGCVSGKECRKDELPVHKVIVDKPFAISKYEVTFEEYDRFAEATGRETPNDRGWDRGSRPVIYVSWEDAVAYARWLSKQTGKHYRLPSEAEWEYAARAGTETRWSFGDKESDLEKYAWYWGNSGSQTHPIGGKEPNPWGLYDVHGNVWEWVQDCWHDSYKGAPTNGEAWESGDCDQRVIRGGTWDVEPRYVRSAFRFGLNTDRRRDIYIGFRLAQDL